MRHCGVCILFVLSVYFIVFFVRSNIEVYGEEVVLETNGSTIIGKKLYTVYENIPYAAFFDIAYAEPPLEKLRFKAPKGPRMLLPLTTYDFRQEFDNHYNRNNENCLQLTVFMPLLDTGSKSFPVAVWVYENSKAHDPDFFIEEEILVVTVSYRRSILGFLNTEDEFARGNMGAKDVLVSLRWIRHNIYLFNGDMNRVTVIGSGQSANIIASFLVSTAADDLFARAVIQSGSALAPGNYQRYINLIVKKLYDRINGQLERLKREKIYSQLRNMHVDKLMSISRDLFDSTEIRDQQRPLSAFECSIETKKKGAFMHEHPSVVYKKKIGNYDIDVMMGYTNLEALFKLKEFINNRVLLKYLNYNFQYILPFNCKPDRYNSKRYKKIQQRIMKFYFINGTMSERSLRRYVKYHSDQIIYPLLHQAKMHTKECKNVYLYRFVYNGCFNSRWKSLPKLNWLGATSGDGICYQFKCKSLSDEYNREYAANEKKFITKITKLLGNFIKYGDPTPNNEDTPSIVGNIKWKPIQPNHTLEVLNLGKHFKIITLPEQKRMEFWDKLKEEFFEISQFV